ncbi:MAG: outer membrane protein assembly factor BamC [Betaproteobacteria bacterium]|nr:outer membrane protein assembly factor BamC [Betaproteobacteria bacterium]
MSLAFSIRKAITEQPTLSPRPSPTRGAATSGRGERAAECLSPNSSPASERGKRAAECSFSPSAIGALFPLIVLLSFALAACSAAIPDTKRIDYKSASQRVPTLEIPPDLTQITHDGRFSVPGRSGTTLSELEAERAPNQAQNSSVLPEIDNLRIERSGNQRWLVAAIPPDRLWDSVKDFWQELGFIIAIEAPEAGIMETDWAENRANIPDDLIRRTLGRLLDSLYSTGERDKFRTRFEPGEALGTTDIFISNRRMEEVYTTSARDDTRWQPAPSDPELEAEMLRRLMVRLGSDERRAEAAIASARTEDRARLISGEDGSILEVEERFDRAWRRVGLALDRTGFTVEDRDRSRGLYFVRYVDSAEAGKKEQGWFSRLFSWGSDKNAIPATQYRIHLGAEGDITRIQVLSAEGGIDQSASARQILALLLEQLR